MNVPAGISDGLTKVNPTTKILLNVNLLQCSVFQENCTAPGALITDFNMWSSSLSVKDMTDWTRCRYTSYCIEIIMNYGQMCYITIGLTKK